MRPLLAVARVTIAEAVRSRVAAALVLGLAAALGLLAVQADGDGTAVGRERAFLAAALDATWALLALAAVFLSTTSLSRELEDGRAIPIGVTPVRALAILGGKCLGVGVVLAVVLALALSWTMGVVLVRARSATPEDQKRIASELLIARAQLSPPRLDPESETIQLRAKERLQGLIIEGRKGGLKDGLPPGMRVESALKRLIDDEVVRALSVSPGRGFTWTFEPIAPVPDAESLTLRFKYRTIPFLPPGQGPQGAFALDVSGVRVAEWGVSSTPGTYHELTVNGRLLAPPALMTPSGGKVTRATPKELSIDGEVVTVPDGFTVLVSEGDKLAAGQIVARSSTVTLKVTYKNADRGIVVVFPPEGVAILHADRSLPANVAAAFGLVLGRILFLAACGLALSTFLEGRVAALATFFVLAVAAAHGFLDDAVGPILASSYDNVFGPLDVPVKAILRGVLLLLPDLGRHDAGEALAQGRDVLGAQASLVGLALLGGGTALVLGSAVLERRELASQ